MKNTILVASLLAASPMAFAKDKLIYTCADFDTQVSASQIAGSENRFEIFESKKKKTTSYKVVGYGELKAASGTFKRLADDSGLFLENSKSNITIMFDTDFGSKGGSFASERFAYELQCL